MCTLYIEICQYFCKKQLADEVYLHLSVDIMSAWHMPKMYINYTHKPVYFNRKPITDTHTSTTSDYDPTSTRCTCTIIMSLTLGIRQQKIPLQHG